MVLFNFYFFNLMNITETAPDGAVSVNNVAMVPDFPDMR